MIATQLFIGSSQSRDLSHADLRDRILRHCGETGARRLAIWSAAGDEWCATAVDAALGAGAEPWLWYPVLADNPVLKSRDCRLVVRSCDLNSGDGRGAWKGAGPDEDFQFYCPNHEKTAQALADDLGWRARNWPWSGVFFDRMRYPSPANGLEGLATCFCDTCRSQMDSRGIDVQALRDGLRKLAAAVLDVSTADGPGGAVTLQRRLVSEFDLDPWLEFRAGSIERVLVPLFSICREAGLGVGLDFFSPSLSGFVGQDYPRLARHADWIKPMSYFRAPGPAGFPVEMECLSRGLAEYAGQSGRGAAAIRSRAEDAAVALTGYPGPISPDEVGRRVVEELTVAEELVKESAVAVFPGVELVDLPNAGCSTDREIAETILRPVRARSINISVSWNLLLIPDDVAQAIGMIYG